MKLIFKVNDVEYTVENPQSVVFEDLNGSVTHALEQFKTRKILPKKLLKATKITKKDIVAAKPKTHKKYRTCECGAGIYSKWANYCKKCGSQRRSNAIKAYYNNKKANMGAVDNVNTL
jgi:hypothetical protein